MSELSERTKSHVAARGRAESALDLIIQEGAAIKAELGDDAAMVYFIHVRTLTLPAQPNENRSEPTFEKMTDGESRDFGDSLVPFGKYNGKRVDDVDIDYWLWLDEQDDFRLKLRRYLLSDRMQKEQEDG